MRTLMDSVGSDTPQRSTTILGRELRRYKIHKIHIAVMSETRFADVWEIRAVGYTFFWSELNRKERRETRIRFTYKKKLVGKFPGLLKVN